MTRETLNELLPKPERKELWGRDRCSKGKDRGVGGEDSQTIEVR